MIYRLIMSKTAVKFRIGNIDPKALPGDVCRFMGILPTDSGLDFQLAMDMKTGLCRGYGLVTVPIQKADSIMCFNGVKFHGKPLVINRVTSESSASGMNLGPKTSAGLDIVSPPGVKMASPQVTLMDRKDVRGQAPNDKKWQEKGQGEPQRSGQGGIPAYHQSPGSYPWGDQAARMTPSHPPPLLGYSNLPASVGHSNLPASVSHSTPKNSSVSNTRGNQRAKQKTQPTSPGGYPWGSGNQGGQFAPWNGNQIPSQGPGVCSGMRHFSDFTNSDRGQPPAIPYRYNMIDIGANLTHRKYQRDLLQVIQRAKDSGVRNVVVTGLNMKGSEDAARLCKKHPGYLYFTAGIHPHDAKTWCPQTLDGLEKLAKAPECVGIGEVGLDFNRNFSPRNVQMEVFDKQVELACRLQKPLFVHEREAHAECIEILIKYTGKLPPVVIHCFTGKKLEALRYIGLGYYIGLTGFLWKDHSDDGVRSLLYEHEIPLDKLLLETDAPFMFPSLQKGKFRPKIVESITPETLQVLGHCGFTRNEPCAMAMVVEMVAGCLAKDPKEVAEISTKNALRFFNIPA